MSKKQNCTIFLASVFIFASCTSSAYVQGNLDNTKRIYEVNSSGKSNKDVADAIEIWVGQNFGSGKEVLQVKNSERGIVVFRYREPYNIAGNQCGVMVTATVKPVNNSKYSVVFSNLEKTSECAWVSEEAVNNISINFHRISREIERAIASF